MCGVMEIATSEIVKSYALSKLTKQSDNAVGSAPDS